MRALDKKLVRDFGRLWPQAVAVALVMACGVATLILATGTYRSLEETRAAYYERYRFGDVFASAVRAPERLRQEIAAIPGVAAAETRIARPVLLDILGMREPATGLMLSLPLDREPSVNALYLRLGRLPEPGSRTEVVINENFAKAQGFSPGSEIAANLNGSAVELTVVGVVLSPEHVYALGPGDMMPDNRRFGVLWMSESALGKLFDLDGAFNSVSLRLLRGANQSAVIEALDILLKPYGGTGAYGRKDQMSNAFLDGELTQLSGMAMILPPVFLLVSAFLINMILSRLITLEREQIGLLKALGFGRFAVGWHYAKFVLVICAGGILIGFALGTWAGRGLTELYTRFYSFPFLIFRTDVDVYAIGAAVTLASALVGSARSIVEAFAMPAAEAMRPPAPLAYRHFMAGFFERLTFFSQLTTMGLRHVFRHPVRSSLTALGTSMAVALMITALGSMDSIEHMIDVIFFQADRQDATVIFSSARPGSALTEIARLPGVLAAEPALYLGAKLTNGPYSRQLTIIGTPRDADLTKVLDTNERPVSLPERGLLITERVADMLHLRAGDLVSVNFLSGQQRSVEVPVSQVVRSYIGLSLYMDIDALAQLSGTGPRVSSVNLTVDSSQLDDLYRSVKAAPVVSSLALETVSRQHFEDTMQQNMTMELMIYAGLAVIIAFGVVYNSARIQLSERARELATLRVIGFTRGEVWWVLMIELIAVIGLSQPLGYLIGYGLGVLILSSLASDLFRVPLAIQPASFAISSLIVIAAALASALIVRRRIDRFDLVSVLKTRE